MRRFKANAPVRNAPAAQTGPVFINISHNLSAQFLRQLEGTMLTSRAGGFDRNAIELAPQSASSQSSSELVFKCRDIKVHSFVNQSFFFVQPLDRPFNHSNVRTGAFVVGRFNQTTKTLFFRPAGVAMPPPSHIDWWWVACTQQHSIDYAP